MTHKLSISIHGGGGGKGVVLRKQGHEWIERDDISIEDLQAVSKILNRGCDDEIMEKVREALDAVDDAWSILSEKQDEAAGREHEAYVRQHRQTFGDVL